MVLQSSDVSTDEMVLLYMTVDYYIAIHDWSAARPKYNRQMRVPAGYWHRRPYQIKSRSQLP